MRCSAEPSSLAKPQPADRSPLATGCMRFDLHPCISGMAFEKCPQIRPLVRHGQAEADFRCIIGECVSKGWPLHAFRTEPSPCCTTVETHRRPENAQHVSLGEMECKLSPGSFPHTEVPVEPETFCISRVLVQVDVVALNPFDNDIPARKVAIDDRIGSRCMCRSTTQDTTKNCLEERASCRR